MKQEMCFPSRINYVIISYFSLYKSMLDIQIMILCFSDMCDYILMSPSEEYEPLMSTVKEKTYISKVWVIDVKPFYFILE